MKSVPREGEQFQRIFQAIPVAASITTMADGRFVDVNDQFLRLTGYDRASVIGRTTEELRMMVDPEDRSVIVKQVEEEGGYRHLEMRIRIASGEVRTISSSTAPIKVEGEPCILAMFEDITERRRLERVVLSMLADQQRRISEDLHDQLGSHLTGMALLSRSAALNAKEGKEVSAQSLEDIAGMAAASVEEVRLLARRLMPVSFDADGLPHALRLLAQRVSKHEHIACRVETDRELLELPYDVTCQLYWIAREAVENAVRHAQASSILIKLMEQADGLALIVRDDGTGMSRGLNRFGSYTPSSPHEAAGGKMGLNIMQHRAALIEAQLHIESSADGGTSITCFIPEYRTSMEATHVDKKSRSEHRL